MNIVNLDKSSIMEIIPHRDPFLFLDEVSIDLDGGISQGKYAWPEGHDIFKGHFPEGSIVPGVCLIEAGAQLAAVSIYIEAVGDDYEDTSAIQKAKEEGLVGVLTGVKKSLFHNIVFPDDVVSYKIKIKKALSSMLLVKGVGFVGEKKVVSFELSCGIANVDNIKENIAS